jgi:hypothetical protein
MKQALHVATYQLVKTKRVGQFVQTPTNGGFALFQPVNCQMIFVVNTSTKDST